MVLRRPRADEFKMKPTFFQKLVNLWAHIRMRFSGSFLPTLCKSLHFRRSLRLANVDPKTAYFRVVSTFTTASLLNYFHPLHNYLISFWGVIFNGIVSLFFAIGRGEATAEPTAVDCGMRRFFTALHGMQTRSSDENSVRASVCLFVWPSVKRVNCDKTEEKSVQIFIPCERSFSLVF